MTTPTRAETVSLAADRWADREHTAACAAWDERDHDADRRTLLTWAENWADWRDEFIGHGLTLDQADVVLLDAVRLSVHPAARLSLVSHVVALCEAVDRLADLTAGLLDPREVWDGTCWCETRHEAAEALLRADVDEAVAPLLTGRAG
jgi:hypothetical protein